MVGVVSLIHGGPGARQVAAQEILAERSMALEDLM